MTVTVTAGAPVAVDPTALTFTAAAWETAQTVSVTAEDDAAAGSTVTITHRVSGGDYAGLAAAPVTVTTADDARPDLVSLQITGSGNTMYPAFAGDVLHYAMTCADATTLQVAAQALDSGARLTLLRANEADNQVADGTLNAQLTVAADHDIAIEVSGGGDTATYVVHCLPADFPDITVLEKTDQVTDGLLFVTPRYGGGRQWTVFMAILDNNGVPRFHRKLTPHYNDARNFRRHPDGTHSIFKRALRGSITSWAVDLLDQQFTVTRTVGVVAPLTKTDEHDFLIIDEATERKGNFLFVSLDRASREFTRYGTGPGFTDEQSVLDSVIQEVTPREPKCFAGIPGITSTQCDSSRIAGQANERATMRTSTRCN